MRRLVALIFLLPTLALGDDLGSGGSHTYNGPVPTGVSTSGSGPAWQGANPGSITVSGKYTCTGTGCTAIVSSISWGVSEYTSGGGFVQTLCSGSQGSPASGTTYNATCASPAVTAGNHAVGSITLNLTQTSTSNQNYTITGGGATSTNAMFWCPTQGSSCTCNGICNGASCGTQISPTAGASTCGCDCTVCSSLSIAAPTSLSCLDQHDNVHDSCSWGAVTGTTTYYLSRGGTSIYSGSATSYLDAPNPGTWSYSVYANGSCAPTNVAPWYAVGNTLSSKNSNTASGSFTVAQIGGIVGCW